MKRVESQVKLSYHSKKKSFKKSLKSTTLKCFLKHRWKYWCSKFVPNFGSRGENLHIWWKYRVPATTAVDSASCSLGWIQAFLWSTHKSENRWALGKDTYMIRIPEQRNLKVSAPLMFERTPAWDGTTHSTLGHFPLWVASTLHLDSCAQEDKFKSSYQISFLFIAHLASISSSLKVVERGS